MRKAAIVALVCGAVLVPEWALSPGSQGDRLPATFAEGSGTLVMSRPDIQTTFAVKAPERSISEEEQAVLADTTMDLGLFDIIVNSVGTVTVCLTEDMVCFLHATWREAQETVIEYDAAGPFVPVMDDAQELMGPIWYVQSRVLDERARRFETAPPYSEPAAPITVVAAKQG